MNILEKISVIILTRNKVEMTLRCLEALAPALTGLDHEVILRDNASRENIDRLREYSGTFQSYRFVRGEENLSFAIANNLYAREAAGNFLIFLNNDVFCRPDTVHNLLRPLIEDAGVGCTGGKLLYPGEKSVQSAGMAQTLWGYHSSYAAGADPDDPRIQSTCERFGLWGAMLCVPAEVFNNAGGFDERYLWGSEDVDLCLKIRAAGRKTLYCPNAVAIHDESATRKEVRINENDEHNYRIYRQTWDSVIIPAEQRYIRGLKDQGVRRVAVFGMGLAARGISKILDENDIEISAFTASDLEQPGVFLDRPALPLTMLNQARYDRLMVASQYFFEIEPLVREYDPLRAPICPLIDAVV